MMAVTIEGDGNLSAALASVLSALGWLVEVGDPVTTAGMARDCLVIVASDDVTTMVQRVRNTTASVTVIVFDGSLGTTIESHLLRAAIEPLAIEGAPKRRVCAVDVPIAADPDALGAAIDFLLRSPSVTGQVIRIEPGETGIDQPRLQAPSERSTN